MELTGVVVEVPYFVSPHPVCERWVRFGLKEVTHYLMFRMYSALALAVLAANIAAADAEATWPPSVAVVEYETTYLSERDHSQPAKFYVPDTSRPRPLLVGLHTWNGRYDQDYSIPYAQWCIDRDWIFIHPHFRGPNARPEATGSDLVVKDIIKAVEYARGHAPVDDERIYVVGASGGGYASLLAAGKAPALWTAVSAWVPVSDLVDWYHDSDLPGNSYHANVVDSLGGEPAPGSPAEAEARRRSPVTFFPFAADIPIDINAGIHDGHGPYQVPIGHSLRAFNALARPEDRFARAQIALMERREVAPASCPTPPDDPLDGDKSVLVRRSSNRARVTLFDGNHEIIYGAALAWLGQHRRDRRPLPPVERQAKAADSHHLPELSWERRPGLPIPDRDSAGLVDRLVVSAADATGPLVVVVEVEHSWVGDLTLTLTHETTGHSAILLDRPGRPGVAQVGIWGAGLSVAFRDRFSPLDAWDFMDRPLRGEFRPTESLQVFSGESLDGAWTLHIVDGSWGDTGRLVRWGLAR